MNIEDIKAVIYDLDGTLYQKKGLKFYFIFTFFFRIRLLLAFLKVRKQLEGMTFNNTKELQDYQVSQISLLSNKSIKASADFISCFMTCFVSTLKKHYTADQLILPSLNFFKNQNIPIICLSDHTHVPERLEAIGINTRDFTLLKSSEEYGALKPSNTSFLAIADQLKISPANFLVIGDRDDTDGEGAARSGMQFIKYPENFNKIKIIIDASKS